MKDLNIKLAEWVGFEEMCDREDGEKYTIGWEYPDDSELGKLPNFPESLDACFKWLVPKLRRSEEYPYLTEIIIDPTMCDEEMYYCWLRYDSLHDDGCVEREETQGSATTPALAFCKALEKLIEQAM